MTEQTQKKVEPFVLDGKIIKVTAWLREGSFNILNTRQRSEQLAIQIQCEGGSCTISETWDLDDGGSPVSADAEPEDIIDVVEIRIGEYLYSGSAPVTRGKIEWARARLPEITRVWLEGKVKRAEDELEKARSNLDSLQERYRLAATEGPPMKLDDIPAEAWRRAVGALAKHVQNCGHMLDPQYADGVRDAAEKIQEKARRIADEMVEDRTPPHENGGG